MHLSTNVALSKMCIQWENNAEHEKCTLSQLKAAGTVRTAPPFQTQNEAHTCMVACMFGRPKKTLIVPRESFVSEER